MAAKKFSCDAVRFDDFDSSCLDLMAPLDTLKFTDECIIDDIRRYTASTGINFVICHMPRAGYWMAYRRAN